MFFTVISATALFSSPPPEDFRDAFCVTGDAFQRPCMIFVSHCTRKKELVVLWHWPYLLKYELQLSYWPAVVESVGWAEPAATALLNVD